MLSLGKALTTEQRLSKAVVDIMSNEKYVALAGILMIGDVSVREDLPADNIPFTACTNGRDEKYGRGYVDSLSDPELRFLRLHENYHKLYRHLITWRHLYDEDPGLANIACDYVINLKLVDDNHDGFAVMPEYGWLDKRFRDMDTARVFDILKQEQEEGNGGGGNLPPRGFDDHDWESAQELPEEEQRELARDIDEAIRQGALIAGKLGTGGDRELQELLKPRVDWREVMREFITMTCTGSDYSTYRRPNRRFISADIFMPSGISESIEGVVVGGDMSGSIGQTEMSIIIAEAKHMFDTVKPNWVRMLYWDTEVCSDEKYEQHELDNFVKSTKPRGGGGTDVECIPTYLTEKQIRPQAVIVITDGYLSGSWGEWNWPVLWVIIDNKQAKPSVGVCVHISSKEL